MRRHIFSQTTKYTSIGSGSIALLMTYLELGYVMSVAIGRIVITGRGSRRMWITLVSLNGRSTILPSKSSSLISPSPLKAVVSPSPPTKSQWIYTSSSQDSLPIHQVWLKESYMNSCNATSRKTPNTQIIFHSQAGSSSAFSIKANRQQLSSYISTSPSQDQVHHQFT